MEIVAGGALLVAAIAVGFVVRRRRVRATRARAEFSPIARSIEQLPIGLSPPFDVSSPNTVLHLHDGPLIVRVNGTEYPGTGTLRYSWLPSPRARLEAWVSGAPSITELSDATLQIPGFSEAPTYINSVSPGSTTQPSAVRGFVSDFLHADPDWTRKGPHHFLLTNFHSYIGSSVRCPPPRLASGARRWVVTSTNARIVLDQVEGWTDQVHKVRAEGGFAIGHVGEIRHRDGSVLPDAEAKMVREALRYFLGLARGFWVGPILPYRSTSADVAADFGPYILSPWRSVNSWFPVHEPSTVGPLFEQFSRLYQDPNWNESLRNAVDWYVEGNTADSLESAIAKAQIALELLAWVVLVDRRSVKTNDRFRQDTTAQNLRDLLTECRVPTTLPSHLADLSAAASSWGASDGPESFVQVRNAIIHPTHKKRLKLSHLGAIGKLEAKEIGLQYVELCLLSLLGFEGNYADRTRRGGWVGEVTAVPWSQP